eukprot:CAMPEP_0204347778 /NCGR_PEP_ID=MMETSP0469-20131031/28217_1 /ASSEMBLY_ACC=CAM_ASM_000384 /TAXON_ID=2969 /ORGANISM="Oxyrrhis marina" /LENGTH=96 /DNA_ID=CAMNT_0051333639 /DNA_START=178 /DNA_END=466 /DNA_ORIENTATION=+
MALWDPRSSAQASVALAPSEAPSHPQTHTWTASPSLVEAPRVLSPGPALCYADQTDDTVNLFVLGYLGCIVLLIDLKVRLRLTGWLATLRATLTSR